MTDVSRGGKAISELSKRGSVQNEPISPPLKQLPEKAEQAVSKPTPDWVNKLILSVVALGGAALWGLGIWGAIHGAHVGSDAVQVLGTLSVVSGAITTVVAGLILWFSPSPAADASPDQTTSSGPDRR